MSHRPIHTFQPFHLGISKRERLYFERRSDPTEVLYCRELPLLVRLNQLPVSLLFEQSIGFRGEEEVGEGRLERKRERELTGEC